MTTRSRTLTAVTVALVTTTCALGPAAPGASALNVSNPICTATGLVSGVAGKACKLLAHAGTIAKAGKKAVGGHLGGAAKTLLGDGGSTASTASTALGLAAIGAWVLGGATLALHETAKVLSDTTTPQLESTWFSAAYWRIAAIGGVLTLPFLFAAAVQALLHSDLALLTRAALGYLPLSLLAVSIAAPVTMLLLSASDQMSAIVGSAAGNAGTRFLAQSGATLGALTILSGSPFLAFLVGLFTAAGALVLWLELLMREAAVYVIVLMLPLVFAAFVWPARRVWAMRAVELLVALILSKFAIVAVLALGGAALSHSAGHSVTGSLAGVVLLLMGAFAPWALLRLVPLAELASGAAGSLRAEGRAIRGPTLAASAGAAWADERWGGGWGDGWAAEMTGGMRRQAEAMPSASPVPGRADQERAPLAELAAQATGGTETELAAQATDGTEPPTDTTDPFGGGPGGASGGGGDTDGVGAAGDSDGDLGGGGLDGSGLDGSGLDAGGPGGASGHGGTGGLGTGGPGGTSDHVGGGPGGGAGGAHGLGAGEFAAGGPSAGGDGHGRGGALADGGGHDGGSGRRERFADWGEMWQAQDGEWRPFTYPFDHESPPQPPWPVGDEDVTAGHDPGDPAGASGEPRPPLPDGTGSDPGTRRSARTTDHQERQPQEQEPEDGWL